LRYHEQLTADGSESAIHLAGIVGENAHPKDSIREACRVGLAIALRDSEQNHEAGPDFPEDSPAGPYFSPADALKNCAHKCVL
jgi:hypothetical protein